MVSSSFPKLSREFRQKGVVALFIGWFSSAIMALICLSLNANTTVEGSNIPPEVYGDMSQFCLSNEEIHNILGGYKNIDSGEKHYNPIDGHDLDLENIRGMRDNLRNVLRGNLIEPRASFFLVYRGMFNMMLGEDEKAIGDFSEARRLCKTAPVYPWLSLLYRESGLQDCAVTVVEELSCVSNDDSLCDQKLLSLILLDELEAADSISNQKFLWDRCAIRIMLDIFLHRDVNNHCDFTPEQISGFDEDGRFAYEAMTSGRLGKEYLQAFDEASLKEMRKYADFYIGLNRFWKKNDAEGCKAMKSVLDLNITGKRMFYEYHLARKINNEVCVNRY